MWRVWLRHRSDDAAQRAAAGRAAAAAANMLRHGGDIFLDDYRVSDVERALGVPVRIAETDGFSLVDAIFELEY